MCDSEKSIDKLKAIAEKTNDPKIKKEIEEKMKHIKKPLNK